MKMIKKAEEKLSNYLKEPVCLVKKGHVYVVQRIMNGDFNKYDHLVFPRLKDVFEWVLLKTFLKGY